MRISKVEKTVCYPSGLYNSVRDLSAQVREYQKDLGVKESTVVFVKHYNNDYFEKQKDN